jgi:hypothetical protein
VWNRLTVVGTGPLHQTAYQTTDALCSRLRITYKQWACLISGLQ